MDGSTFDYVMLGLCGLVFLVVTVMGLDGAWWMRKYQGRLTPMEQQLLMRARKRQAMYRMRRAIREHQNNTPYPRRTEVRRARKGKR